MTISSNVFGSVFFLATGFHGLHVTGRPGRLPVAHGTDVLGPDLHSRAGGQRVVVPITGTSSMSSGLRCSESSTSCDSRKPRVCTSAVWAGQIEYMLAHTCIRTERDPSAIPVIPRRHRRPGILLVFGLFMMGALYSVIAPPAQGLPTRETASRSLKAGTVAVGCASCHGLNGEGQVSGTIQGPPLIGVGAAAVDFQVSTGRMPMARPGAQAPVKPNTYSEEEIAALAAYVASLGPGPAIPEPAEYDTSNISDEDLARGGELFRTNCSACHNFEGAGGALPNGEYAPPLIGLDNKRVYRRC